MYHNPMECIIFHVALPRSQAPRSLTSSTSWQPPFLFPCFLYFPCAAALLPSFTEMQERGMQEEGYRVCVFVFSVALITLL